MSIAGSVHHGTQLKAVTVGRRMEQSKIAQLIWGKEAQDDVVMR